MIQGTQSSSQDTTKYSSSAGVSVAKNAKLQLPQMIHKICIKIWFH